MTISMIWCDQKKRLKGACLKKMHHLAKYKSFATVSSQCNKDLWVLKLKLLLFSTGQIKSKLQKWTQEPQTLCKTLENKITYPLQTENIFCHVFLVSKAFCVFQNF